ncbi:MAG: DUF386 domain-containing protein [Planctomycetes bacterium]|nr:DUF386 domain-containing protein [Planctomycetota bacterium]
MIVDEIENAHLYAGLSDKIAAALEIIKDETTAQKEDGRYEVGGSDIFYMVQRYATATIEEGKLEAHKRFIDLQYIASGQEIIGYAPAENLEIETPYDEDKDCIFYKVPQQITPVCLSEGMFCILWPGDTHMPGRNVEGGTDVCKVVVKIPI